MRINLILAHIKQNLGKIAAHNYYVFGGDSFKLFKTNYALKYVVFSDCSINLIVYYNFTIF